LRAWLASLAPRERAIVIGGSAVAVLVLVYGAVIEPTLQAVAERRERVATLERQVEALRESARAVRRLRQQGQASATGGSDQPPPLAVESVLAGSGLPQPDSLKSSDENGARVEFESVPFDPLVQVLARLRSEHGLVVTRADIRRKDAPGRVETQLTLERAE